MTRAFFRPVREDVLIVREDGESFAVPLAEALNLPEAILEALATRDHAIALSEKADG